MSRLPAASTLRVFARASLVTLLLLGPGAPPAFGDAMSELKRAEARVALEAGNSARAANAAIKAANAAAAHAKAAVRAELKALAVCKAARMLGEDAAAKATRAAASAEEAEGAATEAAAAAGNRDCPATTAAAARAVAAVQATGEAADAARAAKARAAAKTGEAVPWVQGVENGAKNAVKDAAEAKAAFGEADTASLAATAAREAAEKAFDGAGAARDAAYAYYQRIGGTVAKAEAASRASSVAAQASANAARDAIGGAQAASQEAGEALRAAQDAVAAAQVALRVAVDAPARANAASEAAAKAVAQACAPTRCACRCEAVERYNQGSFTGDKESVACVKACAQTEAKEKKCPPRSQKLMGRLGLGVAVDDRSHPQFALRAVAGVAVTPNGRGYLVGSPSLQLGSATLLLPVGFQYEQPVGPPGFAIYARASLGYAAFFSTTTVSAFLLLPELGVRYRLDRSLEVGVEPLSLPIFFGSGFTGFAWRTLFFVGLRR